MKLVIALDLPTEDLNLELASGVAKLGEKYTSRTLFKVGLNTFILGGAPFMRRLGELGMRLVLDLKLHDIPHTMGNATHRICEIPNVELFTVHASSGFSGMWKVYEALRGRQDAPKAVAVTVLTSMANDHCRNLCSRGTAEQAKLLVAESLSGGMDGIVCSPVELPRIEEWCRHATHNLSPHRRLIRLVPGVELAQRKDDHDRKGNLLDCIKGGADYIVVGRPIYESPDPVEVVKKIHDRVDSLKECVEMTENMLVW